MNAQIKNAVLYTDLPALTERMTKHWSTWGPKRLIREADILQFGDLTQNHQWIHEPSNRCHRESPYGEMIAHGLFIIALIPSLLPDEEFLIAGHRVRVVRGIDCVRIPSPVYPEDTVHARVRCMRAYSATSGKGTIIERAVEVWSENGSKPAVTCVLKLQYF